MSKTPEPLSIAVADGQTVSGLLQVPPARARAT